MAKENDVNRDQKVILGCNCQIDGKEFKAGEEVMLTKGEKALFEAHGWTKKEGK